MPGHLWGLMTALKVLPDCRRARAHDLLGVFACREHCWRTGFCVRATAGRKTCRTCARTAVESPSNLGFCAGRIQKARTRESAARRGDRRPPRTSPSLHVLVLTAGCAHWEGRFRWAVRTAGKARLGCAHWEGRFRCAVRTAGGDQCACLLRNGVASAHGRRRRKAECAYPCRNGVRSVHGRVARERCQAPWFPDSAPGSTACQAGAMPANDLPHGSVFAGTG